LKKECNCGESPRTCTPYEKQNTDDGEIITKFFECLSDGDVCWKEMSYNRYVENSLDYGEPTEWEEFLVESTLWSDED